MKSHVSVFEIEALADKCNLAIQHDCGGFRVVTKGLRYVFPDSGICPTATKRECLHFLMGVNHALRCLNNPKLPPPSEPHLLRSKYLAADAGSPQQRTGSTKTRNASTMGKKQSGSRKKD